MMMNMNYYFLQSLKWEKCEVEELFKNPYLSVMLAVIRPNLFWDFILNYQLYKGLIHFLKTSNSKMNRDKCSYLVLYKEISLNSLLLYSAPYIDGTALCTKCKAHNEYFNIKTSSLLH